MKEEGIPSVIPSLCVCVCEEDILKARIFGKVINLVTHKNNAECEFYMRMMSINLSN